MLAEGLKSARADTQVPPKADMELTDQMDIDRAGTSELSSVKAVRLPGGAKKQAVDGTSEQEREPMNTRYDKGRLRQGGTGSSRLKDDDGPSLR